MRWLILTYLVVLSAIIAHAEYQYKIKYFTVPLDHFSYTSNKTFQIRYLYNDTYVRSSVGPILFYTGNEGDIELFAQNTGFIFEIAPKLEALIIFAEHRYYGKSLPFGNSSFDTPSHFGYLSSQQALADYADLLEKINPPLTNDPYAKRRPVIAIGGSYGGMLAAWFRMKYPHLITGALASSAPILQFGNLSTPCDVFSRIVTSVFEISAKECSKNIRKSWDIIKKLSAIPDGRSLLKSKFLFCSNYTKPEDADEFFDYLTDVYGSLAMVNYPYNTSFLAILPAYPVRVFCSYLEKPMNDTQLIDALQQALSVYANYTGTAKCLDISSSTNAQLPMAVWDFQACTEMVMPQCSTGKKDMFPKVDWDLQQVSDECFKKFMVRPSPSSAVTSYGGKNLEDVTNIIFSNGLLDPWSGGGVLRSPNDRVQIIIIPEAAHHLDLRASNDNDPTSVVEARIQELNTIQTWIRYFWN